MPPSVADSARAVVCSIYELIFVLIRLYTFILRLLWALCSHIRRLLSLVMRASAVLWVCLFSWCFVRVLCLLRLLRLCIFLHIERCRALQKDDD